MNHSDNLNEKKKRKGKNTWSEMKHYSNLQYINYILFCGNFLKYLKIIFFLYDFFLLWIFRQTIMSSVINFEEGGERRVLSLQENRLAVI